MANDKKSVVNARPTPAKAPSSAPGGMTPAARQQAESLGFLAIAAGVLVALNVLGVFLFHRFDTTRNEAYSLADGSLRAVTELDETLTVTAYFSSSLPAPFNATERYVRDILEEYESASNGMMTVRFVSPDEDEEREEAERLGVQLVQHQHIENDAVSVVEGYRGIVFEYLGNREVIPVIQPDTEGLEYDITTTIRELTGEEMTLGILSGHEGPTPTKGLTALERMMPSYDIREVAATETIDPEISALLIIEPSTEITEAELRNIDQYVMHGGSLGVFGGGMHVDIAGGTELTATAANTGLNTLLEPWGIRMAEGIVADANCERVPMPTSLGISIPVPYPPAPVIHFTEDDAAHPVLFRLNQTSMFFASPIETTETFRNFGEGARTLMRTSEPGPRNPGSWLLPGDNVNLRFRQGEEWISTMGGDNGPFVVAVALETDAEHLLPSAFGESESADHLPVAVGPSHILVVGSSSVLRDEFLGPVDRMEESDLAGRMAFPLNAIDWLSQDSDLIAIRAKTIEEPQLEVPQAVRDATDAAMASANEGDEEGMNEAIEQRNEAVEAWDGRKFRYRLFNTALIPVAVALFGVFRWWMRRNKRASLKI